MFLRARSRAGLAVLLVTAGLATAGPQPAIAAGASPCHADDLAISKAGREAAAGNRYLDLRIENVSGASCRLTGFPTYTWRRHGHRVGRHSVPEAGQAATTVRIRPGQAAYTTLHWVDPGPVPDAECHPRRATGVHLRLAYRPHVYRFAIRAQVCTTEQYRPTAYPVRATKDVG